MSENENTNKLKNRYIFICTLCGNTFTKQCNLSRHTKNSIHKSSVGGRKGTLVCPFCNEMFWTYNDLDVHVENIHSIKITEEQMTFNTKQDFENWKHKLEADTQSGYRIFKLYTKDLTKVTKYICHRSGKPFTTKVHRQRATKMKGPNGINCNCPATIITKENGDGIITVHFFGTHVGHTQDVGRLRLSNAERQAIAAKLYRGIPPQRILKDISMEYPGWTRILVMAGFATVLGSSTPVGYNIGVINTPGYIIKHFCNESVYTRYDVLLAEDQLDILWSSIVSIFLIGGTIGSLSGSLLANKIGRKGGLGVSSVLGVFASVLFWGSKDANSIEMLLVGRIFGGLSAGLITTIMPMYLMELSPPELKGATGALCPLGVTLGILLGQIMSMYHILGNENYWPHCLAICGILQLICGLLIPVLPESPKYLYVIKKQPHHAIKQLKRIRNASEEYLADEIEILRLEGQENLRQGRSWNISKVLKSNALLLPLLLVCFLQAGQQLSGVNAVFYYSTNIFQSAGLSTRSSELATIGAGFCNIFMAIISVQTMSWFNRRTLLQISLITSTVFLMLLGLSISYIKTYHWMPYLCIVGVLGYVLCYGLGLGPIPYFIGSELFEVGPRSSAMALGSMANWGGNFVVGLTFPILKSHIGAASFFIFAVVVVALLLFVRVYLPETKGKDACDIHHLVKDGFRSKPFEVHVMESFLNEINNVTEKTSM